MYLAEVPLLAQALEGVCIPLPRSQSSGVEPSWVDRRGGVGGAVLVDPSDLRPTLDGDVGRLEAEVLDQDRPGGMFLGLGHSPKLVVLPRYGRIGQLVRGSQSQFVNQGAGES